MRLGAALHVSPAVLINSFNSHRPGMSSRRKRLKVTSLVNFDSEDIIVERTLGTLGFMSVSSYTPQTRTDEMRVPGMGLGDIQRLGQQDVAQGGLEARIYVGRVARGALAGTRVLLKAYPRPGNEEADALAANEVATHASLQPPTSPEECPYLYKLLGGFQVRSGLQAGEQWLVFRNDGSVAASSYAAEAAEATRLRRSVGQWDFFDGWDPGRPIQRRRVFVTQILRQVMQGVSFMHRRRHLHQSLGPASVLLNRTNEMDVRLLNARLRDFAFAVDVSDEALVGGATLGDIWDRGSISSRPDPRKELANGLWQRAKQEGALTTSERRSFGIADDIYAAGLLLAYMTFVPFSQPGSVDGPSLQRLLETTFQLDVAAARDFCEADERWEEAVKFLGMGNGAGWELLAAMLNPQWRLRPTADSCLNHPFLNGKALDLS